MPFKTIQDARDAGFPTSSENIPLTLAMINKLAAIYDSVKAADTAENAMAVAWTQWKALYVKEGDKWVLREKESAESMKSSTFESSIDKISVWIPVAVAGQSTKVTTMEGVSDGIISAEALKSNLDSWNGGFINVNHIGNGAIKGFTIEDAKYENDTLYHKVNPQVAEFIINTGSSGRSIEGNIKKRNGFEVLEFDGTGLSVLYPPYQPACTKEMGCVDSISSYIYGGDTMNEKPIAQSAVREIFTKLADTLKSHSFMNSMIEETGKDPNLETNEMEEIEKPTSARIAAETSRDEALKEVETLKSSLVEKDTTLSDKDKTISEQTERLKSYETAEAEAAVKLRDEQWETLKSSIPAGKIHKEEDAKVLKEEFLNDPGGFAVKMASWKREDPQGESGAEYTGDGNTYLADRAEFDAGTGGK